MKSSTHGPRRDDAGRPLTFKVSTMTDTQRTPLLFALLIAIGLVALPSSAFADVRIAATLGDLGAIAQQVGGDKAKVTVLAAPQQDPHFVDAKPSYVAELSKADIVVLNGMSLEVGWLPSLITGSRNPDLRQGEAGYFDASQFVVRRGVPSTKIDRSMGDVHPEGDPHYTFDPRQGARVAIALGKRLAKIDPDNGDYYEANAREFAKECIRLAQKWELKFGELDADKRTVVVFHEAWSYIENWLKLEQVEAVEPKPGVPPNPKHVAKVLKTIKSTNARAILQMEYYPDSATNLLAEKTGAELVRLQGQAREGESYLERVDRLAEKIYNAVNHD
jgi:zinc/manganese transport system substrate-binding protein